MRRRSSSSWMRLRASLAANCPGESTGNERPPLRATESVSFCPCPKCAFPTIAVPVVGESGIGFSGIRPCEVALAQPRIFEQGIVAGRSGQESTVTARNQPALGGAASPTLQKQSRPSQKWWLTWSSPLAGPHGEGRRIIASNRDVPTNR